MKNKKVVLVVLDGFGVAPPGPGNAISQAKAPHLDSFMAGFPHTQLGASGESVGLPRGEVGNTETGHLNIGAGRIIYQDLARINMSVADGSFFENQVLLDMVNFLKSSGGDLHLMGLLGAGGVHSAIEHLYALIHFAAISDLKSVFIHAFTDGRDSPPNAAISYISQLEEVIKREGVGQIASLMGRYWAMDRDLRWDRTAKAYFALTKGEGNKYNSPREAVEDSYKRGQSDEFIDPSLMVNASNNPVGLIKDGDVVVFFNFRIDGPRQLTRSFVSRDDSSEWDFDPHAIDYEKHHQQQKVSQIGFVRGPLLDNLFFATMTEYEKSPSYQKVRVLYPPQHVLMPLGRAISDLGMRQLRAAESEKERFVTYYMNGLLESPFEGEDRLIVPSPRVSTYDLAPEMSALSLADQVIAKMQSTDYALTIVNFANADMVGHTGNLKAGITAVETIDKCVGRIGNFILDNGGLMIITADHGNAEEMINPTTGAVSTEHSGNPVPFVAVSSEFRGRPALLSPGILADIAPTILRSLGIQPSASMMGRDLLSEYNRAI